MAKTSSSSTKLHLVMYPWFAFGHFIPFLNLSNKLAQRGHSVSFVLPKGAQSKLEQRNKHPNLIRFFPLVVPHVDGIPVGAETASDAPSLTQLNHLCTSFDQCKDQLQEVLASLSPKPDFVFMDFAYWVPALARSLSIKSVFFSIVSAAVMSRIDRKIVRDMAAEELIEAPRGYPCSALRFRLDEAETVRAIVVEFGSGVQLNDRLVTGLEECDAIAVRTCREIEGPFCDYLAHRYRKRCLLTGPILDDATQLEDKWIQWLGKFEPSSVVFCAFGSQVQLEKDQYEELLRGFESCERPFLIALVPPEGCLTVEEAFPEGFEERTRGKGWAYGGWVPQADILNHPSVGCFVSHGGLGSTWEFLQSDCQIVLVPVLAEQIISTRLLTEELKVGVEVERSGERRWISNESLRNAIESVMDETSESACEMKINHARLKSMLSPKSFQESYTDAFVRNLQDLKD